MSRSVREAMLAAIEMFGAERKLGDAIGYSQHSVWRAKTLGRCSPRMALAIYRATRGRVRRAELCPGIFSPSLTRKKPAEISALS